MAMGQQKDRQGDLMVGWAEMPRSPGHVFYDRLQSVLIEGGFDAFAEASCRPYYAARMGAPSVPPGRYFRMHLVGYFEGIDSERGLEWRCSDSLSLREFLRLGSRERVPDHSWLSKTRARLPHEVHAAVFDWVLALIGEAGLVKGERIGVDASTMEANAALRNIVRRDTGEGYREMLEHLARESGIETPTAEDLARLDRKRKGKKLSNQDWVSRSDPEAKIAKMKDGTTHLAYKPEHAVDLDTGAVVAAELHPADEGDTTTLPKTAAPRQTSRRSPTPGRTRDYHRAVLKALDNGPWKTRIAEPKQKDFARWRGDEARGATVTNNRTRRSGVAKEAFKLRAEIVERSFAHNLDRGGMRRTWLRGRENVHKRYLLHVAGHNLSLLMRQLIGAGTPRDRRADMAVFSCCSRGPCWSHKAATVFAIPHLGVRAGKSHLINGLAEGGLLEGRRATLHWDELDLAREKYPGVRFTGALVERSPRRLTGCGSLGTIEFALELVAAFAGREIADRVMDLTIHGRHETKFEHANPALSKAIKAMSEDIGAPLAIEAIAQLVNLSTRQLTRKFDIEFGIGPGRYYLNLRLDRAHELITKTRFPLSEIALSTGFNSASWFSRAFKAKFSKSPTEARKRRRLP